MDTKERQTRKTEITPEMIEAGFDVFLAWEASDAWNGQQLVRRIFESMDALAAKVGHRKRPQIARKSSANARDRV